MLYTAEIEPKSARRQCESAVCGPTSVYYFRFKDGRNMAVMPGTPECDYTLKTFDPEKSELTVAATCLPSVADWKNPSDAFLEEHTRIETVPFTMQ